MVKIIDGICDSPDICRNKSCPYFDMSEEATKRYLGVLFKEAALLPSERGKTQILEFTCPFLAWKQDQAERRKAKRYR